LRTAEQLLGELHSRFEEPLAWELKRRLAELLVSGLRVDSLNESGKPAPAAEVPYGFAAIATRTGTNSSRQSRQKHYKRPSPAAFALMVVLPGRVPTSEPA
jgi:hypothetical protein